MYGRCPKENEMCGTSWSGESTVPARDALPLSLLMAASVTAAAAAPSLRSPLTSMLSPIPITRRKLLLSSIIVYAMASQKTSTGSSFRVIDSHLHVWASPQQAAGKYPYFPGQEPTLRGDVQFLLENMDEAGVEGALIVQPINHMFDHSLVTSVLRKYPSKFVGCCLANPAEDGSGIKQLEHLIVQEKYRAVRFNPKLWPSGQKMTNEIGRALFAKAGELGAAVGILVMKGIQSIHSGNRGAVYKLSFNNCYP